MLRTHRARRALLLFALVTLEAAVACAALLGARPVREAAAGRTTFHAVEVDGRKRTFLLHLPPAAAQSRVPLVILFHGDGATANEIMSASRMNEYADARGVAVAYPNGTGSFPFIGLHWNVGTCCGYAVSHHVNDIRFADALVSVLSGETAVDSSRVFAAGFSAGGMLALRLACERAMRYRAVADVAGAMPDTTCAPARPVSVLFFQGQKDDDLRFDFHDLLRRGRPFATSLEAAMRFWARRDGCTTAPARDSTAAYRRERATCPAPLSVQLYTVKHHPHAWPGGERNWFFEPDPVQTVKASPLILDFFAHHAP